MKHVRLLSICAIAALYASCATGPAAGEEKTGAAKMVLKSKDMPYVDARAPGVLPLLSESPSLDMDGLPGDNSIFAFWPIAGTANVRIQDTSLFPKRYIESAKLGPVDFSMSFFRSPQDESILFGYRDSYDEYLYLAFDDGKRACRLFKNQSYVGKTILEEAVDARKKFEAAIAPLRALRVSTLSGNSAARLAGKAVNGYKLCWEGVSIDACFYAAAFQTSDLANGKVVGDGFAIPSNYSQYRFLFVMYPDRRSLVASLTESAVYKDGFSVFDGRDREGYDRDGLDPDGYDRWGWAGRVRGGKAEFVNRDGESWSGALYKGRQGWGVLTRPDGSLYIGTFRDDAADGIGVEIAKGGERSVREWRKGTLVGSRPAKGTIVSPSGDWVFLGPGAEGGFANGRGDAVSADGRTRILGGLFSKGSLVEGTMVLPGGASLSGAFLDGVLIKGSIEGSDGSRYEGELEGGVPDGKGTMTAADGTTYVGDFAKGQYDGKGTISRPDGERYEGEFKAGKPHGSGIYFDGRAIERCEYYEGTRIDQAYQIRQENAKQLEALRQERERIAKEKADKAEQDRIAAEREAAASAARSAKSSNNLIAGLFGIGAALAGGSIGMNAGEAALLGVSTAIDVSKGDANLSTTKSTGQAIVDAKAGKSPAGSSATAGTGSGGGQGSYSGPALPNLLARKSELMSFEKFKDDDFQLYSQCATAQMYYDEYKAKLAQGRPEAEALRIYEMHRIAAENALAMWGGIEKARAEKAALEAQPKPAPRRPAAPGGSSSDETVQPAGSSNPRSVLPN